MTFRSLVIWGLLLCPIWAEASQEGPDKAFLEEMDSWRRVSGRHGVPDDAPPRAPGVLRGRPRVREARTDGEDRHAAGRRSEHQRPEGRLGGAGHGRLQAEPPLLPGERRSRFMMFFVPPSDPTVEDVSLSSGPMAAIVRDLATMLMDDQMPPRVTAEEVFASDDEEEADAAGSSDASSADGLTEDAGGWNEEGSPPLVGPELVRGLLQGVEWLPQPGNWDALVNSWRTEVATSGGFSERMAATEPAYPITTLQQLIFEAPAPKIQPPEPIIACYISHTVIHIPTLGSPYLDQPLQGVRFHLRLLENGDLWVRVLNFLESMQNPAHALRVRPHSLKVR